MRQATIIKSLFQFQCISSSPPQTSCGLGQRLLRAGKRSQRAPGPARAGTVPAVTAYLRLLPPGSKYVEPSLGRIVTAPEARRTGLGRALVAEGLRRVEQLWGSLPVRIGAQRYLERFYGEFGFETASPEYDEDGIPHVEMVRTAR